MYLPGKQRTVYDLTLLNKVTDSNGNIVQSYEPQVHNQITDLSPSTWQNLHSGMEMAIGEHDQFNDLQVSLAGKTGTAQENEKRPNHALFVGYAPTDSPADCDCNTNCIRIWIKQCLRICRPGVEILL